MSNIDLLGIVSNDPSSLTVLNSEIYGTMNGVVHQGQLILKNSFIHDLKSNDYGISTGVAVSYILSQDSVSIIENNKISNTAIAIIGTNVRITNNEISHNEIGVQGDASRF